MIALKEDLFKAIEARCKRCVLAPEHCSLKDCSLFPYRTRVVAKQTDIFRVTDSDVFMSRVLQVAESYGGQPFFWSELRAGVKMRPLHDNWWGVSTRILKSHGFRVVDGARRSTHKSRCGAFDRRWQQAGGK